MKKLLIFLFMLSAPAYADITSKFTSSVSVKVDAAMSQATRIGASYSASGSNIGTSDTNDQTVSNGTVTLNAGDYSINGCGETPANCASTWSLSESYTAADTIPSNNGTENTTITAGTVPNFGSVISTVAGSGDGFAGSITSGHGITGLHEGDAGSTVTGQFVTELTIR
jgi:hypothetical protein